MDNITVNMENLSEEERTSLIALIEKANKPQSKVWRPREGESYYRMNHAGDVWLGTWTNHKYDIAAYEIGNCFQTEEEAEEKVEELKVKAKWKRLSIESGEEENEWDGINLHWMCSYSYDSNGSKCISWTSHRYADIYFATKESLKNAIKEIGEDNVKRYILGIK